MELVGVLSNSEAAERLARAAVIGAIRSPARLVVASGVVRGRHGWMRRAIVDVLARATGPMTPKEVHMALLADFPTQVVAYTAVKASLCHGAAAGGSGIARCGRGRYESHR
jgi:hypothetical protein